jgi:hypothetical protein
MRRCGENMVSPVFWDVVWFRLGEIDRRFIIRVIKL